MVTNSDLLNQYRVFPRIFAAFYLLITWEVWQWVKITPDLTNAQAAFAMAIVAGAVGYFKYYVDSGIKRSTDV